MAESGLVKLRQYQKKKNITSELNDRSFESNSCGAEKQRSENTRTGGCKERFTFWIMQREKNALLRRKQKSKLKKYLLAGEGRRRDKLKILNKHHRAVSTHSLDTTERRTRSQHERNVTD